MFKDAKMYQHYSDDRGSLYTKQVSISCMQINCEIGVNKNKISNWFQYNFFTLIVYNTPLFVQRLQKKTKVSSIQEK